MRVMISMVFKRGGTELRFLSRVMIFGVLGDDRALADAVSDKIFTMIKANEGSQLISHTITVLGK